LSKELAVLDRYLDIEKTRFGPRLVLEREIQPETLGLAVPNLILQPLVENSIKHGVEKVTRPVKVTLAAYIKNGQLAIEVKDDGPGLGETSGTRQGIGLSNTRARLQQLYGDRHLFHIETRVDGGVAVTVLLPAAPASLT
jgi:sensor histidine kinase YesM